jgi:hypothetical protein
MSRRNTSQRPPEPPQDRTDRLRLGRPAPTSSARREKQALRPPMAGRGRGGGTRLARDGDDAAGGSTSQTGPSQTMDPTQYQQHYDVYQQPHDAYQFHEPQPHQYQFVIEEPAVEEPPVIEEPQQNDEPEQPQQHEQPEPRFQGVPRVVYEAGPDGYAGGPSELSLLPNFGGHVACRIWVDADVSII